MPKRDIASLWSSRVGSEVRDERGRRDRRRVWCVPTGWRMSTPARKIAIGLALVAALVVIVVVLPARQWAIAFVEWVRVKGAAAAVVFAVTYIVAAVLLLPGSVLTLGAGYVYGAVWGTLIVVPASIAAALISFLTTRRVGRAWVANRAAGNQKFEALDRAIEHAGFKITLLVRLSPIFPFGVLNYALGLTTVTVRDYVLASALGMLPGTIAYVYLGSLVTSATDLGHSSASWLYWVGGGLTVAASVAITLIARNALKRELRGAQS